MHVHDCTLKDQPPRPASQIIVFYGGLVSFGRGPVERAAQTEFRVRCADVIQCNLLVSPAWPNERNHSCAPANSKQ